jgi:hypothetical protein
MKTIQKMLLSGSFFLTMLTPLWANSSNPFLGSMQSAIDSKDPQASIDAVNEIMDLLYEGSRGDRELIKRQYVDALKMRIDNLEKASIYSKAIQGYTASQNEKSVSLSAASKSIEEKLHPVCVYKDNAKVVLYYINGMFNSELDVASSVTALESMVSDLKASRFSPENQVEIRALYNENEPLFQQLAQVTANKLGDTFAMFWDYYYYLDKAPDWFKGDYFDLMVKTVGNVFRDDENPRTFNELGNRFGEMIYNEMFYNGVMPILIGHSQGGLYVNAASRYLEHKMRDDYGSGKFYGTVVLGSPVGRLHSSLGNSILRADDFVMRLVRIAVGTMRPDYNDLAKSADRLQHNFVEAYLKDSKVKSDFQQTVQDIFSSMLPHSANKTYGHLNMSSKCNVKGILWLAEFMACIRRSYS